MTTKQIIKIPTFWKTVVLFWLVLVVLFNGVRILITYGTDFAQFASEHLSDGKIWTFLAANVLWWFVFVFFLVLMNFKKNLRQRK